MQLLVYCAGGFGKEVMDLARRLNQRSRRWDELIFLDDGREETVFYGAQILRFEEVVRRSHERDFEAVIANGEPFVRKELADRLNSINVPLAVLIDDTAVISETASIGPGAVIYPGCFVSSNAVIGDNVAIIAGSNVGHDTCLGANSVLSGNVNTGGACTIDSECYIGMGVQIKEGTKIGSGSIVGMGSVVYRDIPDDVIALGNPCRPMQPNERKRVFG
jgi:sugar O-acyltransferase (sialic acid O-acetyltransferase NeuD family)